MSEQSNSDTTSTHRESDKPALDRAAAGEANASTVTEAVVAPSTLSTAQSTAPPAEPLPIEPLPAHGAPGPDEGALVSKESLEPAMPMEALPVTPTENALSAMAAAASEAVLPSAAADTSLETMPAATADAAPRPPKAAPTEVGRGTIQIPPVPTGVSEHADGSRGATEKRGKAVRPRIQWRSFSGWFALLWLFDLGWMIHSVLEGPGEVTQFPVSYVVKVALACTLALLLAFLVPIAMLDDSSHHPRAWWVAWLWPPIMALMLVTDIFAIGYAGMKLYPLVELLKKH